MRKKVCGSRSRSVSKRKSHKGKPKPLRVWVSPAPEKERENVDVVQPSKKERERERERQRTTNMIPKRGRVLKGKRSFTVRHRTQKPNTRPDKNKEGLKGLGKCRVAGPMGRAAFLGRHPRGPWYRGVQRPPYHGNRPWWRKN